MDQKIKHAQLINQTSRDFDSIPDRNIMRQDIPRVRIPEPPPLPPSLPQPRQINLPCGDLLHGSRENYIRIGLPLYKASLCGDWKAAKNILDKKPELVRFAITENYETALHLAATAEDTQLMESFVANLVNLMDKKDLEYQNMNSNTAFSLAAAAGNVNLAKIMVVKNIALPEILGDGRMMPLHAAAFHGKPDMVKYLYAVSQEMNVNYMTVRKWGQVIKQCVEAEIFDIALTIMTDRLELTENCIMLRDVLRVLAGKPDAFSRKEGNVIWRIISSIFPITRQKLGPAEKDGDALKLLRFVWGKINILPTMKIDELLRGPTNPHGQYPSRSLFVAAEIGNTTFIVELLQSYPDLMWKKNDDGLSIFHIAVKHRHQDIYNLLYEIGFMKDLITPFKDKNWNNMLHLVGTTSKQMRPQMSRASLPMQRELLWYKEVKKMMPPSYSKMKNKDRQTPYEILSENNEDVVSQGLERMKDCMVVATLIVTVAFAVAFTVPGGYNQNNGIPMFLHKRTFIIFVIADAISLFCSSASLLVFLSLLTSRHGQRDFIYSLPRKLMTGLVTLFISVIAMMVTFSASFFVLYHNGLKWVPILISALATVPVILFAMLQFPLLVDMFRSMYDSRYIFKPKKNNLLQLKGDDGVNLPYNLNHVLRASPPSHVMC